jgi:hypothetical protein
MYRKDDIERICSSQQRINAERLRMEKAAKNQLESIIFCGRTKDAKAFESFNSDLEQTLTCLWQLMFMEVDENV